MHKKKMRATTKWALVYGPPGVAEVGVIWGTGQWRPTHPPPPTSEKVSSGKSDIYSRGPKLEADCRYINLFWRLTLPPWGGLNKNQGRLSCGRQSSSMSNRLCRHLLVAGGPRE